MPTDQVATLGTIKTISFTLSGLTLSLNPVTVLTSWAVIALMLAAALIISRSFSLVPTRTQSVMEITLVSFDRMLSDSLGSEGRKYIALVTTLFLFVLISNWASFIPGVVSPTSDLNTTLGLALLVLIISHFEAIRMKGLRGYIKAYFEPYWFLFPSNIISEFSKVLSHSFRLFGNMFAGGIVLAVIPIVLVKLFKWLGVPLGVLIMPVVKVFFVIFLGAIQAFVFAVLAIAYISVLQQE